MQARIHAVEPISRANGPGRRTVVWFQGCRMACPGCYNPETHDPEGGYLADTAALAQEIIARRGVIEGVSISGGEPFQQAGALADLLERVAAAGLSALVFTGFTREELDAREDARAVLAHVDVLVAGRYDAAQHVGRGLLGSANQRIHLLTDRYSRADVTDAPPREVIVHADGSVTITGVAPE